MLSDIAAIRNKTEIPQEYYDYVDDSNAFSQVVFLTFQTFKSYNIFQVDMSMVQGAFFGQFLLYPDHYGGKHATQEDLEDFLMFWRANGYYLGINDRNNAVLDTLEETKIFAELVMERILKPCMLHLNPEAIHMAKVVNCLLHIQDTYVFDNFKSRLPSFRARITMWWCTPSMSWWD